MEKDEFRKIEFQSQNFGRSDLKARFLGETLVLGENHVWNRVDRFRVRMKVQSVYNTELKVGVGNGKMDEFGKIDSKAKIYAQTSPKPDFWAQVPTRSKTRPSIPRSKLTWEVISKCPQHENQFGNGNRRVWKNRFQSQNLCPDESKARFLGETLVLGENSENHVWNRVGQN